ncbi:DEHA2D19228p [Debaryomyces hansenii CBS767]|uniref:DEHA2D19228p n=1 Tax=Debaryomyces hansenii (strain ATCC 36239 / CBS 767 / BCRC 21394 / JCM 1990 / NBRC 0083 / IGC 2968) TaxID=284592 RepID=W0TYS4_DEBHA|nr:DEHA2D19228p [Debaryomyces hansenii CBS767]CAG87498.2 DEHA2D19228p [Debaryomyces hansenii CBS767]|eukprot:XP_002770368.1 DEHA2D19228p [Debaryomyces hansenii CBS767]
MGHVLKKGPFKNLQIPEVCFAIGDYKKGTYNLARGFEELKVTIKEFKQYLLDTKRLRSSKSLQFLLIGSGPLGFYLL